MILEKLVETHCHDCHEDVDAKVIINGEAKVKEGSSIDNKVDVEIPIAYQCPKCKSENCGPVGITFVIGECDGS